MAMSQLPRELQLEVFKRLDMDDRRALGMRFPLRPPAALRHRIAMSLPLAVARIAVAQWDDGGPVLSIIIPTTASTDAPWFMFAGGWHDVPHRLATHLWGQRSDPVNGAIFRLASRILWAQPPQSMPPNGVCIYVTTSAGQQRFAMFEPAEPVTNFMLRVSPLALLL